jgi:hypothetical protein
MNIVKALNYAEHNKGCVYRPSWNGHIAGHLQFVSFVLGHFVMTFDEDVYPWMPSWLDIRANDWEVLTSDDIKAYNNASDIMTFEKALSDVSHDEIHKYSVSPHNCIQDPNYIEVDGFCHLCGGNHDMVIIEVEHVDEAARRYPND